MLLLVILLVAGVPLPADITSVAKTLKKEYPNI
jgi:hypothetical protein